jgi:hypothetical protein
MRKIIATGLAAATLLSGLGIGSTASAQYRRHYDHHDRGGAALAAGIAGLAVGAAIAGSHPHYYYGPYGYYYGPRCRVYSVWDPYYGAYVQRRRCW